MVFSTSLSTSGTLKPSSTIQTNLVIPGHIQPKHGQFHSFLKSDSHLSKNNCFIYFNESPLQMFKNAFYFILKALFALKIFKFLYWLLAHFQKTTWLEIKD